jgi:tellurite resistance protein TerC
MEQIWLWIGFHLFILAMLALDLGVFHRKKHSVSVREGLIWSIVWIVLALLFNLGIFLWGGGTKPALEFLAGYLIEKSLSVDNIFVFVLIFGSFAVPATYQHGILFWGVLIALVLRGLMIALGATLIHEFHWIIYLFGAFLVVTGIRMAMHSQQEEKIDPERHPIVRAARRIFPVTGGYESGKFFILKGRSLFITPLFLVFLVINITDLVFAVDSIPAIFAVTRDPFLVYTSNIFAILGLRSLYFVLAGVINKFYYLKMGLAVVLTYVGIKMLLADIFPLPIALSLGIIAAILTSAIIASLVRAQRIERSQQSEG